MASEAAWNHHIVRRAFASALGVAVGYALLVAVSRIEEILLLVAVALLFSFGLNRPIAALTRHHWRRPVAAGVVLAATVLVFAGILAAVVPTVVSQVRSLVHHLPGYATELRDRKGELGRLAAELHLQSLAASLSKKSTAAKGSGLPVHGIVGVGETVLSGAGAVIFVVALTCYLVVTLPRLEAMIYRLVPASRRDRVRGLGEEIITRLGGYVLGNLFVAAVAGLGTMVWLLALGLPFPFALAVLVALLGLIPVVGSSIGGILVSLVALTRGLPVAAATLAFYVTYRLFEDYLLVPRVMRRTVAVSPLVTIVALLIGGSLLGIVGALLAVPTAAAVQLVVAEVALPKLDAS